MRPQCEVKGFIAVGEGLLTLQVHCSFNVLLQGDSTGIIFGGIKSKIPRMSLAFYCWEYGNRGLRRILHN